MIVLRALREPLDPDEPLTPQAVPVDNERRFGPELPKRGRAGQLTMLRDPQTERCTLWLCVADGDGSAAKWAQVLLGTPFDGRE
ncbi:MULTISPECIES: hypothetical protein [unclassified Streptomyces]|uniref:hypothetical protein n=1 Tax=unclassified Streptomyces TaxID=2593676 RepID=UPI00148945AE|nr:MULTISPECIES: hypothetical protein [unclassified Streptomyces]